jgi:hypothetical protein
MPIAGVPGAIVAPAVEVDVGEAIEHDHVHWGPIVAGVVTAFAVLLFLTVLGVAIGISALGDTADRGNWGTAAGIWGAITLLVAFFLGGWMAARSAGEKLHPEGILNGFITGAAMLLLLLWLATTAVTGALGFFTSTVADLAGAAAPAAAVAIDQGAVPGAENAVNNAVDNAQNAVNNPQSAVPDQVDQAASAAAQAARQNAAPGAWGTAIAMILAVVAAMLGGMVGQNNRPGLLGSRRVVARP